MLKLERAVESSEPQSQSEIHLPGTPSSAPETFDYFPKLPLELQRHIWKETIPLFPRLMKFENEIIDPLYVIHSREGEAPQIPYGGRVL